MRYFEIAKYKTLGAFIVGAATVAGIFYGIYGGLHNKPMLVVDITASSPTFRLDTNDAWSAKAPWDPLSEITDYTFVQATMHYLTTNKFIKENATDLIEKRYTKALERLEQMETKIPVKVIVSNNGRLDTTILSGRLLIHDYKGIPPISIKIESANQLVVEASRVKELAEKNLYFEGTSDLPRPIMEKIIYDFYAERMELWGLSEEEGAPERARFLFENLFKYGRANKWVYEPVVLEVVLKDQFGNEVRDSTVIQKSFFQSENKTVVPEKHIEEKPGGSLIEWR